MPQKLVEIQGHADPAGERFCHALADTYAEGARAASGEVRRVEVGQLEFPLLRTEDAYHSGAKRGARSGTTGPFVD